MFHAFNSCIENRLNQLTIPVEVRQFLSAERIKLAAADIPQGLNEETRRSIKQAIDECFVFGFRRVMLVGAGLALTGSLMAGLVIRSRESR